MDYEFWMRMAEKNYKWRKWYLLISIWSQILAKIEQAYTISQAGFQILYHILPSYVTYKMSCE